MSGGTRAGGSVPVGRVDGLYAVVTSSWVAGFVVRDGQVRRVDCAPILWRRLEYWTRSARPVPAASAPGGDR